MVHHDQDKRVLVQSKVHIVSLYVPVHYDQLDANPTCRIQENTELD